MAHSGESPIPAGRSPETVDRLMVGVCGAIWLVLLAVSAIATVALVQLGSGHRPSGGSGSSWLLYTIIVISAVVILGAIPLLIRARRAALAAAGLPVPDVPGEPEQPTYTQKEYADAVEARFDREAQALGYDSVAKAATYVSSLNSKFATEAAYFIALRDACWLLCFAALEDPPAVKPTPAEFAEAIVTQALAEVGQPIYS